MIVSNAVHDAKSFTVLVGIQLIAERIDPFFERFSWIDSIEHEAVARTRDSWGYNPKRGGGIGAYKSQNVEDLASLIHALAVTPN